MHVPSYHFNENVQTTLISPAVFSPRSYKGLINAHSSVKSQILFLAETEDQLRCHSCDIPWLNQCLLRTSQFRKKHHSSADSHFRDRIIDLIILLVRFLKFVVFPVVKFMLWKKEGKGNTEYQYCTEASVFIFWLLLRRYRIKYSQMHRNLLFIYLNSYIYFYTD